MATNYTGNVTPSLSNAPASSWTDDATKASHVGNTYLVTGSGGTAGNVYSFEEYAAPLIKTATGLPADIVTITDGGDNKNALKAEVSLSPIQSLNGYDHPWAPGAGTNKIALADGIDFTLKGIRYYVSNGSLYLNGTSSGETSSGNATFKQNFSFTLPAGTYYFTRGTYNGATYLLHEVNGANVGLVANNGSFTLAQAETVWVGFYVYNKVFDNTQIPIQVVAGSTAPSTYSPFSNLCPITGHAGATLKIGAEYPTADREYTSSFGQTVYGGTYDFVSGKLTTKVYYDRLLSTSAWYLQAIGGHNYFCTTAFKTALTSYHNLVACTHFGVGGNAPTLGNPGDGTITNAYNRYYPLNIRYDAIASVDDFKTFLADNEVYVCIEAASVEYTLTPAQVQTLLGLNNVWASDGQMTQFQYTSNQFQPAWNWFENWTMPKITRNNGSITVLPYPQEYTPEIYDVDAATTGRNAAGTMIRDRVARKHKFNYKFPPLSQADATEILAAVQDASFTLTTASPETGAKTNYTVYVGDRSLPVYWMPNHDNASWLYSSLSLNLIEM